ncbi:GNAT family N-acetyltransferase [Dokdonia sp. Hel_I_53]|uniref:GNAT family N-acetyltransferase n=1 Tax=Dokdonia sp. Hel_I_53 TaxID=1566287 RepID=UPI00119C5BC5|nr:GNAT family N-acetyltransferase [Dokdonia sp. Hel_I_53]TVZ50960.1 diamine N-acetyltransferase [Dokdonia sp. Hel_I_53]
MNTLIGEHIYLRALEPEDIEVLYSIENNEGFWNVGETITPFSRYVLKEYLSNAYKDIYESRQLRMIVCDNQSKGFLGLVDLFDFDPHNLRAGVGIIIAANESRKRGYGFEVLALLKKYCASHLKLHQLYANIEETNTPSVALFEKAEFKKVGLKKDWRRIQTIDGMERYTNEYLYQYIF